MNLSHNLRSKRFSEWSPRSIRLTRNNKSRTHDWERNLLPVIFIANQTIKE